MPAKPKAPSTVPPIEREAWDFEPHLGGKSADYIGCSDLELRFCFEYEYSRQAFLMAENGEPGKQVWHLDDEPDLNKFRELFDLYFPQTPWLKIPHEERSERLAKFAPHDPCKSIPPFAQVTARALSKGRRHENSKVHISAFGGLHILLTCPICIDLMATDTEIAHGFENWLRSLRSSSPKLRPKSRKNASSALRTALKELGALRLREEMSLSEVHEHTKDVLGYALYGNSPSLRRAVRAAECVVDLWTQPDLVQRLTAKNSKLGSDKQKRVIQGFLRTRSLSELRRTIPLGPQLLLEKAEFEAFGVTEGSWAIGPQKGD